MQIGDASLILFFLLPKQNRKLNPFYQLKSSGPLIPFRIFTEPLQNILIRSTFIADLSSF